MKNEESSEKDDKDEKSDKQKALFIQRLFAYLIDLVIISVLAAIISLPFMNAKELTSLEDKLFGVFSDFYSEKIESNEYEAELNNVSYEISRVSGPLSIATIFLSLLYFVVYQLHSKGQTIGKRVMKIRVVSDEGDLNINQLIFRSFIANSILLKMLDLSLLIFAARSVYFTSIGYIQMIQSTITLISIFMVMYSKSGLAVHDRLVHTKVIRD